MNEVSGEQPAGGAQTGGKSGRFGFGGRRASLRSPNDALQPEAAPPPPEPKPKKKRRASTLSSLSGALTFMMVLAIAGIAALSIGKKRFDEPGPLAADKVVVIARGADTTEILDQLQREGVISSATLFNLGISAQGRRGEIKAGEYQFKARASMREVMTTLVEGKSILHAITIPEGLTSEQIVQRVREHELLAGDVRELPKEGTLFPDTYRFARGLPREQLLNLMRRKQDETLKDVWARRAQDLPVRSPFELVTLASIIEKETGRGDERNRVAGVFVNRLQKRMRLQSDPTIVYGLVGGKGTLGRGILRSEVLQPTPYNTYVIDGLPPGPIANPGRAALEAAANPARTRDLYFVADGTGGHAFAETLEQHNRNVQRWRQIERDAKDRLTPEAEQIPASAPGAAPPAAPAAPARPAPARRGALDGAVFGALPRAIEAPALAPLAAPGGLGAREGWAGTFQVGALVAAAPGPEAPSAASAYALGPGAEAIPIFGVTPDDETSAFVPEIESGPDAAATGSIATYPVS
ncbi:MAG: endolytic transglycosylase MltG, partial [Methylobacteriaceae bacterium]|nr:endolytic transglycosylase MltG [Methylobacteriaceae bacterium]